DAGGLLGCLREALLAEDADRPLLVAARLAERLLAVEETGAGLLAQLLHELESHPALRLRSRADARGLPAALGGRDAVPGRLARAALPLLVEVAALDDGLGDRRAEEADRADGIVVAGNLVVDQVGIAVRIDDRDDRDGELVRLLDRDLLLLRVDDEEGVGQLAEPLDPTERGEELLALVAQPPRLLLREGLDDLGVLEHLVELLQAVDRLLDGLEIGEHAAEPPRVHVERAAALGLFADRVLRLLLRADEEHLSALRGQVADEVVGVAEHL